MDGFDSFKAALEKKQELELSSIKHEENQIQSLKTQEVIAQSFNHLIDYLDNRVSKTAVVNQLQEIGTPDALKVVTAVEALHDTLKTHENTDLTEITGVMRDILDQAKQLPKEINIPEHKETDYSKQFDGLTKAVQAVEKVVKAQKLVAEAPIVNVPETNVNVEAPDLKPLQNSIKDVVKAVKDIVIPEYKTDNKDVEELLKKSNKLLKDILQKPVSSGGGGGLATPYKDQSGMPAFPVLTADGKISVEAGETSTYESFVDTTTDVNLVYLGKATPGTATSAGSWQIKRYNKSAGHMSYADDVTTFTKTWDNRTSYSY